MSISQTKETPGLIASLQGAREVLGHLDLLISRLQIYLNQVKLVYTLFEDKVIIKICVQKWHSDYQSMSILV